jgi:integrase
MGKRGRVPSPWYRKTAKAWYVTLDGRQVRLGKTKREAVAEFARLMAERGRPLEVRDPTVGQLVDLWLADRARAVRHTTMGRYRAIAGDWAAFAGELRTRDLRPYHVQQWLDRKNFSRSTRHLWMSVARSITRWATGLGYIERDTLAALRAPGMLRRSPATSDQLEAVVAAASPETAAILRLLALTGIRPGELATLSTERIDLDSGVAVVVGKTGERLIHLSSPAAELLRSLMEGRRPGRLWPTLTTPALYQRVRRASDRAGVKKFSPHRIRGLYATEAIRKGVDSLLVSKLLGHKDPSIVAKHYANPDAAMLREAAEKAVREE